MEMLKIPVEFISIRVIDLNAFIEHISLRVSLNEFNYHVALQKRLNYISNSKFITLSTNQPRKRQAQTSLNSHLIKLGA